MAEDFCYLIPYLAISFIVSLIFVILGIVQYRSKTPVTISTGEKPPRKEDLTDMAEWNHKHGRNWIIYGCLLFLTMTLYVYFIEKFDSILLETLLFLAACALEIVWVVKQHKVLKEILIIRPED